ncbi:DegT/DnrJ/EryC1/StrS family aminotransferase [Marinobacter sp. NP-4(2019)]|uniref:DegT/DnrJ/EryC1/StrS family aminotransferase n=1 Tax=Marinobacter sp. NP-4(2019) TaxID=2488665 RepID=UPI0013E038DE|nr:DegT/DnrJ/EryC1/StrS family aminotransferase [Marinobacter sp. NP-4(2019)]
MSWNDHYRTEFTGSGTEALSIAVAIAIAHKPEVREPEVIIPAYGCPDLVSAIIAQGGKPVLVDLLPESPYMNEARVRDVITTETVAVVGVDFLGIPERLDVLSQICRDKNLFLIEDSAQRFPPVSSDKPLADLVVLSFGRGKPINLMGGGAVFIRRELADRSLAVVDRYPLSDLVTGFTWMLKRSVFNLLMARFPYYFLEKIPLLGIGETRFRKLKMISRLELPAELVSSGIRYFHGRPLIHRLYDRELRFIETFGWKLLGKRESGRACGDPDSETPRLRYAVLAPDNELRNQALRSLNRSGIGATAFYNNTLPRIEGVDELLKEEHFPCADDFASRLLTLPCHEDVKAADIALIANIFSELGIHR